MELTIHLDAERAQKLAYLQQHSTQDPTGLLVQAIDQNYQKLRPSPKNAYQIFEEFGLIGCMDSSALLPPTDHPSIREQLQQKRRQGTL